MSTLRQLTLLCVLILLLTGCASGSEPRLVASYPQEEAQPIAQYVPQPPAQYVYNAFLTMDVSSPASAAEEAEALANDYSGYLVSSQSWHSNGKKLITVVLAVPAPNFERLLDAVEGLGTVQSEQISGEWVSTGYSSDWNVYSQITIQFNPKAFAWPSLPGTGWHPGRTLENAFGVFLSIFGFLADVIIWVAVVVGPFVLIGLGIRAAARRLRK
ncbi:MAG: DUF4349 domain-containing protein [Anaerolineales bacterium]|nr:DUF4349 domain-containing protein [Anaerolineales bacterium]